MPALLADENADGHLAALLRICNGPDWRGLWSGLSVTAYTFADLGLARATPDDELWAFCQARQLILLTANRNEDGPDSLSATIREHGTLESLPVLTLADADRMFSDRAHAERVAGRLIELLLDLDHYRGTGRLYLP